MAIISLKNAGVTAIDPLFQNLDLIVGSNDRLGLVAGNGRGKTTLLRCIAGQSEPTSGEITCSRGMKIGFVEQDVPTNLRDLTFYEAVRRVLPSEQRESETWRVDSLWMVLRRQRRCDNGL